MCPPKIRMLNPAPKGDSIRKRGLWEVIRSHGQSPHEWVQCLQKKGSREIPMLHKLFQKTRKDEKLFNSSLRLV